MRIRMVSVFAVLTWLASACANATDAPVPLALGFSDFPQVVADLPLENRRTPDESRHDCAHTRVRRVDELDARWQAVIERITFACKDVSVQDAGDENETRVTDTVVELKAGAAAFFGLPVADIRLQDAYLWGNAQFRLAVPYSKAGPILERQLSSTCGLSAQRLRETPTPTCEVETGAWWHNGGLYVRTGELGGTWVNPDESNPQRTIVAEAWSD